MTTPRERFKEKMSMLGLAMGQPKAKKPSGKGRAKASKIKGSMAPKAKTKKPALPDSKLSKGLGNG